MLSHVGDHLLQEFNTLSTKKYHIKIKKIIQEEDKNLTGEEPQTDKHLPQSPFTGTFF